MTGRLIIDKIELIETNLAPSLLSPPKCREKIIVLTAAGTLQAIKVVTAIV